MCANGPLAWSVLAFNHAMIFHSYPHVTSAVVHLSPMILSYGLRWHVGPDDARFTVCAGRVAAACDAVGFGELVSNALQRRLDGIRIGQIDGVETHRRTQ